MGARLIVMCAFHALNLDPSPSSLRFVWQLSLTSPFLTIELLQSAC